MGAASYGDRHARVYDRIYGRRFAPDAAVRTLAAAAAGGAVLELGVGTGRLAIPLAAGGIVVDGIEASPAMVAQLRSRPGAERVGVHQVDLAGFRLPRHDYAVAVCAVSTLFMLEHAAQLECLRSTATHLRPGGRLYVEAFRPDAGRFDSDGHRVEDRTHGSVHHVVRSTHDPHARTIRLAHELDDGTYEVVLHHRTPEDLDDAAAEAGFRLAHRWHD
ncbi:MAG: class I SAM-dependent methyltransferase, partial [Mycobacteriaceae bacterium]